MQVVSLNSVAYTSKAIEKKQVKQNKQGNIVEDHEPDTTAPVPESDGDEEAALLKFIKENHGVGVGDCMKYCTMSKNRAGYVLKKLFASGTIHASGKGRATMYMTGGT